MTFCQNPDELARRARHTFVDTSPPYERGTADRVAFVLSCPGRLEERDHRPAAGLTGRNLDLLLEILRAKLGRDDLLRGAITIANAWPHIEYQSLTGRSEAEPWELKSIQNVERLESELAHVTGFVVFCGDRARTMRPHLAGQVKRVEVCHLGGRGLCRSVKVDVRGRPLPRGHRENTRRRLEVIAERICAQLDRREGIKGDSGSTFGQGRTHKR